MWACSFLPPACQVNVPILGLVENMSFHICSNCGHREEVFGAGGVQATAEELGLDVLGKVGGC